MLLQKLRDNARHTFLSPPLGQFPTYMSKPLKMLNHPKTIAAVPNNQCTKNHAGLDADPLQDHTITIYNSSTATNQVFVHRAI
jgi:hypothetical protein